jgi:hypothetical protein
MNGMEFDWTDALVTATIAGWLTAIVLGWKLIAANLQIEKNAKHSSGSNDSLWKRIKSLEAQLDARNNAINDAAGPLERLLKFESSVAKTCRHSREAQELVLVARLNQSQIAKQKQ